MTDIDDRQMESTVGGDRRLEAVDESDQRLTKGLIVKVEMATEL